MVFSGKGEVAAQKVDIMEEPEAADYLEAVEEIIMLVEAADLDTLDLHQLCIKA